MIINGLDQWVEGTYCFDGYGECDERGVPVEGTGPKYFLGSMTLNERTPIVAIGAIRTEKGWLLFAQNPEVIYPQGTDFCLAKFGEGRGVFEVMTIDTGWEADVVGAALQREEGIITRVIEDPTMEELVVKQALRSWVQTLRFNWTECTL